jgi:hypothetical protein
MKTKYMLAVSLAIAAAACSKEDVYVGETEITPQNSSNVALDNIPFATKAELQSLTADATLVNWEVARKLSMVDMELVFKNDMGWEGAKLSERPVLIYGSDSRPKYYEFIVYSERGESLGTLTAYAKRESDAATAFALPSVRDYSAATTKYSGSQLFATGYPNVGYGIAGKSGDEPANVVDESGADASGSVETPLEEVAERYEENGVEGEDLQQVKQQIDEVALQAQVYWQVMDEIKDSILATSDEQIVERCNESKGWEDWKTEDIYIIPAYNSTGMRYTRWSAWCGPSAMAWMYRGLYSSYNGQTIYLYGNRQFSNNDSRKTQNSRGVYCYNNLGTTSTADEDGDGVINKCDLDWIRPRSLEADNGLYYELSRVGKLASDGGMYYWNCATAFSSITGGKYSLNVTNYNDARSAIRNKNLPVLVGMWDEEHYVAGFGIRNVDYHFKLTITIKIFRWEKTRTLASGSWRQSEWMLVTDNGNQTSAFSYLPYWQQTYVYLHQKVVKNW